MNITDKFKKNCNQVIMRILELRNHILNYDSSNYVDKLKYIIVFTLLTLHKNNGITKVFNYPQNNFSTISDHKSCRDVIKHFSHSSPAISICLENTKCISSFILTFVVYQKLHFHFTTRLWLFLSHTVMNNPWRSYGKCEMAILSCMNGRNNFFHTFKSGCCHCV